MDVYPGYHLQDLLYRTEYRITYRAIENKTSKPVLLKVLAAEATPDEAVDRLKRESEIASVLDPDGELSFKEMHMDPHTLVDRPPAEPGLIARHLGSEGLSAEMFLPPAVRLAGIVSRLHRQGWVYCDLNPGIMLLNPQKRCITPFRFQSGRRNR